MSRPTGPAGSRCNPPAPDCDIIAGSISQCLFPFPPPSPYYPPSNNNNTRNSTSSSPSSPHQTPPSATTTGLQGTNTPKVKAEIETVKGWRYRGCYTDDPKQRTLISKAKRARTMTPDYCAWVCRGYRFFGVEYSNELSFSLLFFPLLQ